MRREANEMSLVIAGNTWNFREVGEDGKLHRRIPPGNAHGPHPSRYGSSGKDDLERAGIGGARMENGGYQESFSFIVSRSRCALVLDSVTHGALRRKPSSGSSGTLT